MYLGRIVALGKNKNGENTVMYRVSSRSFPNRETREIKGAIAVMPRPGHEDDLKKSPYITYNCLRLAGDYAIATNGSHTDPIAEKIAMGSPVRDALAATLLAMDYEKDDYNTPRIAAVVGKKASSGWLGIVRHDAVLVQEFELNPGTAFYVATYEINAPQAQYVDENFDAANAADACQYIVDGGAFKDFELPVTSAAALETETGFELATQTV